MIKAQISLGNQRQGIKIGGSGIGSAHFRNIALESGITLFSDYLFKANRVRMSGFNFGYDAFMLAGIGKNNNLLASSFLEDGPLLGRTEEDQHFYGIGFGFEKEFLPGQLRFFNQRLGKLLMRFSHKNHSINVQFKNDFRSGMLFLGQGTDYGTTGMLQISYSNIINPLKIYHLGVGALLFTPKPDHSRTPNNSQNSDDGSKNVWYTMSPYSQLFYANLYTFGGYQESSFSAFMKAGMNSQKLGAYIQNALHDSFGLNPRFPWDVSAKDLIFFEVNSSVLNTATIDD